MATEEQIKQLAYSLWEREGQPEGRDVEHYFAAKQMREEQEAVEAYASTPGFTATVSTKASQPEAAAVSASTPRSAAAAPTSQPKAKPAAPTGQSASQSKGSFALKKH